MIKDIVGSLLGKLGEREIDAEVEEKSEKAWAPKHGPAKFRTLTNGQIRRAQVRSQKARQRKATKAYRRDWLKSQQELAGLRGLLQAAGRVPYWSDHVVAEPLRVARAEKVLEDKYGSVDEAFEIYTQAVTAGA